MNLFFINVGHGDSSLIELTTEDGDKVYILIDTNIIVEADSSISHPTIDFLEQKGIKKINWFILSHLHRDHYSGIDRILQLIEIDKLFVPAILFDEQVQKVIFDSINSGENELFDFRLKSLATLIYYLKENPQKANKDERISLFSGQFLNFEAIFYNTKLKYKDEFKNKKMNQELLYNPLWHNYSIIGYFKFKNQCALFTGDVPLPKVVDLMNIKGNTINILKVPHHGKIDTSPISILYEILASKSCVVISDDGKNNISLIKELKKYQIPFYSTNELCNCVKQLSGSTIVCHDAIKFGIQNGTQWIRQRRE